MGVGVNPDIKITSVSTKSAANVNIIIILVPKDTQVLKSIKKTAPIRVCVKLTRKYTR